MVLKWIIPGSTELNVLTWLNNYIIRELNKKMSTVKNKSLKIINQNLKSSRPFELSKYKKWPNMDQKTKKKQQKRRQPSKTSFLLFLSFVLFCWFLIIVDHSKFFWSNFLKSFCGKRDAFDCTGIRARFGNRNTLLLLYLLPYYTYYHLLYTWSNI